MVMICSLYLVFNNYMETVSIFSQYIRSKRSYRLLGL